MGELNLARDPSPPLPSPPLPSPPLPSHPFPSPPPLYVTLLSGDMTAHGKKGLTGFVFIYQDPDDGDRDRLKITRSISLAEDLHKKEEQVWGNCASEM